MSASTSTSGSGGRGQLGECGWQQAGGGNCNTGGCKIFAIHLQNFLRETCLLMTAASCMLTVLRLTASHENLRIFLYLAVFSNDPHILAPRWRRGCTPALHISTHSDLTFPNIAD